MPSEARQKQLWKNHNRNGPFLSHIKLIYYLITLLNYGDNKKMSKSIFMLKILHDNNFTIYFSSLPI